MSHETRKPRSAWRLTALASAVAVALGTLSLAGCGNEEDELPPMEEEAPAMEEQGSPMEDATSDPGIDQTDTASGDGAEVPGAGAEENTEGAADSEVTENVAPEQDPLPEAEQEPVPEEQPEGQQATMEGDQEASS
ncbi:MAG: hypothetical protein LPK08_11660, partial [Halomonas sp.]|nr:hypothetical protein [Halomonas sp.]